jgi:hypothetical protein
MNSLPRRFSLGELRARERHAHAGPACYRSKPTDRTTAVAAAQQCSSDTQAHTSMPTPISQRSKTMRTQRRGAGSRQRRGLCSTVQEPLTTARTTPCSHMFLELGEAPDRSPPYALKIGLFGAWRCKGQSCKPPRCNTSRSSLIGRAVRARTTQQPCLHSSAPTAPMHT